MVRTAPVIAQAFRELPTEVQDLAIANGAVPVNEVFYELWFEDWAKIWLLYGGFGSGKSVFIADKLIDLCLNDTYFKCMYGRKIKDTVRDSIFATICNRIEFRGLQEHFSYSTKPKSSMVITCIDNNNSFLPFGCDDPTKLKSIKDPSHIFCDEMDQFDKPDFLLLYSRLRYENCRLLFIAAFNTDVVTPQHWIKDFFFNPDKPFEGKIKSIFCNYPDNAFINQEEYRDTLWISAGFDQQKFEQIAQGDWGTAETENQFAYSFMRKKHVISVTHPGKFATPDDIKAWEERCAYMAIDERLPVYLVFDFNVDPVTCLVCQRYGLNWGKILKEYRLRNSDIFELCERIRNDLGQYYLVATGDASGRNRSSNSRGKASHVDNIKTELRLSPNQVIFPKANPSVANTRIILNAVLKKHPEFFISSDCNFTIDDMETCKTKGNGEIDKTADPLKTHLLDNVRYFIWNFFRNFVNTKN